MAERPLYRLIMPESFSPKLDPQGLMTAVVQDARTRSVLMVAHMNPDALDATRQTGLATFWSRSRAELWEKGATSGNRLRVRDLRVDCDGDAVLLLVEPEGPACHTGATSCFHRRLAEDGAVPV